MCSNDRRQGPFWPGDTVTKMAAKVRWCPGEQYDSKVKKNWRLYNGIYLVFNLCLSFKVRHDYDVLYTDKGPSEPGCPLLNKLPCV